MVSNRREALHRWQHQAKASSAVAVALSRLLRRRYTRSTGAALNRWRCAAVESRADASAERLEVAEAVAAEGKRRAKVAAAAALWGALARGQRRSLEWGFGRLEENLARVEMKVGRVIGRRGAG